MAENVYSDSIKDSATVIDESLFQNSLNIPQAINTIFNGSIIDAKQNYSKTVLKTNNDMVYDDEGLIHSGFIFSAADWSAQVAVNQPFSVTIGSKVSFFAPAKVGDIIEFEAHAYFDESKKREIKVIGKIKEIKVFEGTFQIVVLEDHIFKLQKKNKEKQNEQAASKAAK
ncbi:thioesterase [Campylobacter fetus subsp. venerealis LMG 6570 = CCUG 33900]|nr:thioesterase [Campylobacter fetus subsp. venerealis LMG 6570 = CCUG 33900]